MEKLIKMIDALVIDLEKSAPYEKSVEWYLLNNLIKFRNVAEQEHIPCNIADAARVLNRFAIDSMDWEDSRFKAVTAITEKVIREYERG